MNELLDIDYKGKGRVVTRLLLRGKGLVLDEKFLPYFYIIPKVPKEEIEKLRVNGKGAEKIEEVEKKDGRRLVKALKIYVRHPSEVPDWREAIKPFGERREFDIPFVRRYMIDHDLAPLVEVTPDFKRGKSELSLEDLKVLAFDIEVLAEGGLDPEKSPIVMISLWGKEGGKVITWGAIEGENVVKVASERELLRAFVREINQQKPDLLVGYNIDAFDFKFIKARARKFGVKLVFNGEEIKFVRRGLESAPRVFGLNIIDLYTFVRNILAPYLKTETLDLNAVAKELIGEEKVQIGGMKGINQAWRNGDSELYHYSLQDARITYLLALELLPMIIELAKIVGLPIFDVARMTPSQLVEWLLIRRAYKQNMLVPNRPKEEEIAARRSVTYEGAFVKEPIKGLHAPIAVCDFRSLYPTIIIAHNISPETIKCEHEECRQKNMAPNGVWFCTKERGFLPSTVESLLKERLELKALAKKLKREGKVREAKLVDAKQKALKLILNSFYGYTGFPASRWYNIEVASAITAWGREYIRKIMKTAEELGFIVVYGDTDSVMLTGNFENFKQKVLEFLEKVNSMLPEPIKLELEGFFVRGLFVTKKRYALLAENGEIVVKGLERVRRDWAPIARKTQEEVLRLILEGRVEEAEKKVKEVVEKLRRKEIPIEEVIIREQLTKPVEEYKQMAPHVKVAMMLKKMGKRVEPGALIEYVVQPGVGSISERAVPAELARDYDAEYYIENQVLPAVMRLFEAFGKSTEELRGRQASLDQFF